MPVKLGLDIGAAAVRAVELVGRGRHWRIRRLAEVSRHDPHGGHRPLALALAELDGRLRLRGDLSVASSDLKVLIRYLATVPMPRDRLERLLRLEMQQQAGTDGELAADAQVLPIGGDEVFHCCVYAQPEEVRGLLDELTAGGIRPERIHIGPVALGNTLLVSPPLPEDAYGLIVDIGAKHTTLILHRGDTFQACRQLPLGGDEFTEALAREWQVPFERAEQAKLRGDLVASTTDASGAGAPAEGVIAEAGAIPIASAAPVAPVISPRPVVSAASAAPSPTVDPFVAPIPALAIPVNDPEPAPAREPPPVERPVGVGRRADSADRAELLGHLAAVEAEVHAQRAAALDPDTAARAGDKDPTGSDREDAERGEGDELPEAGIQTQIQANLTMGPQLRRTAERLINQINAGIAWFQAQLKLKRIVIARVALCGGGAELAGLVAYCQRRFRTPCTIYDPCAGMTGTRPIAAHRFATAIGLALAGTPGSFDLDVRPESLLRRRTFWRELVWPWVAAVVMLAATGLLGVVMARNLGHYRENVARYRDRAREYEAGQAELRRLGREHGDLRQDFNAIVSRLFGGRDMLMTILSLKVNAPRELWCWEFSTTSIGTQRVIPVSAPPANDSTKVRPPGRPDVPDRPPAGGDGAVLRGGGRGGQPPGEVLYDSLVDRGSLSLRGFVKPEAEAVDMHKIFYDWVRQVEGYVPPEGDKSLFQGHWIGPAFTELGETALDSVFRFEVRFDYHPGRLSLVAVEDE
jgi:Tfp pilus assembly PilM family ATPase